MYRWDVFTGVSAGSINAGMMSVWPKGKEVEMSENLSHMCQVVTPNDTMTNWKTPWYMPSYLHGLLYEQGLMDMQPMVHYLDKYFANFEKIQKKLVLSAVDVETGEFTRFDETMGLENLGLLIRASGSVPVVF